MLWCPCALVPPLPVRPRMGGPREVKAYLRLDPLIDERKSDYTPAQLGAFVKVLALASRQKERGTFKSAKALAGALPSAYARHLAFLVEQGDLIERRDGSVYVDGYDEWQEGDLTVRDRMAKLRNRRRNNGVTGGVTQPSPAATRSSSSVDVDSIQGSPPLQGLESEPAVSGRVSPV